MFAEFSLTKGHLNTVVFKNSVMFQIASVSRCIGFGAVIVIIGLKVVSYLTERWRHSHHTTPFFSVRNTDLMCSWMSSDV